MSLTGSALRVTIFIGENDMWHHRPVFTEILHRARKAGLAGATVFRGIEGFGASSLIHTVRLLSLGEDLPQLDELVTEGLVILDDCEVIRCTGREKEGQ
ncbi:DUF190 domain-containing protein [Streptomyces sp. NPDC088249]|uniref:DUF190 domain-containing protein n=1 Tax=Streptomyces sp. NPDC088249 TaxID=3365843 RepID=UPI0038142908